MAIFGNINPVTGQTQIGDPVARMLIAQSTADQPIHHPLQLAGRLAQLGVGMWRERDTNEKTSSAFADTWKQSGGDLTKFAELARANPYLRAMGPQLSMKLAEAQFKTAQDVEAEKRKSKLRIEEKIDPRVQEFELRKAAAARPSVSVKVSTGMAEADVGAVKDMMTEARGAASEMRTLSAIRDAITKVGTGRLAGARLTVGQWEQALGISFGKFGMKKDELATAESILPKLGEMIAERAKTYRPVSEDERRFIQTTLPQLSNTPGGNLMILDFLEKANRSKIKSAYEAYKELQEKKSLSGYYRQMYEQHKERSKEAPQGAAPTTAPRQTRTVIGPDGKPRNVYTDGKQWFNEDGTPLK